jgi:hypothetical protein
MIIIAKLGGYLDRKCDRVPGFESMWRGYTRFCDMVEIITLERGDQKMPTPCAMTGFWGKRRASLSAAQVLPGGEVRFQFNAELGSVWRLEGSPDLHHWGNYGLLTNQTSALQVTNIPWRKFGSYFYRAASP